MKWRECEAEMEREKSAGCLTLSDVHFLHPRVHDNGRLVFPLAGRFPLHLSRLRAGHPGLALQVTRGELVLTGCVCVPAAGEGRPWVLRLLLSILPIVPLQRVSIAGLLWCVWRRWGLHGLITPSITTTTVLGVVVIPPLFTKITVIFFTRRELRLSIFTAHHVGLHD